MTANSCTVARGSSRFVYFIQSGGADGPIKIGVTTDPELRLKRLQTGSAEPLTLLGIVKGDESLERAYHARLAAHRTRGEWFRPVDQVMACVPSPPRESPLTFEEAGALLDAVIARKLLHAGMPSSPTPAPKSCGVGR